MSIMSSYIRKSPENYKFKVGDTAMFVNDGEHIAGGIVLDCQTMAIMNNENYCKLLFFKSPESQGENVEGFQSPIFRSFKKKHTTGIFKEGELISCRFLLIEKALKK